jgi:acetoin:2,6-dichlorophenolindophenol oxidoreductase subunit alpha
MTISNAPWFGSDVAAPRDASAKTFYSSMRLIATFEERLLTLFSEGLLHGTVHTCLGQESSPVGVLSAVRRELDVVVSNHRCHGHYLAYREDVDGLLGEIMGRETGTCRGIGGSQHVQAENFYSNGVLGGMPPIAVGMALAERIQGRPSITVIFMGDGAMAEGAVYEAFNMAALWRAPVLFVLEDNGYAQTTPSHLQHAGVLAARVDPFGIPRVSVDGEDVFAVHAAASRMVNAVREERTPSLLHIKTYRLAPHSKGDDTRDQSEIEAARERQPLRRLAAELDPSWVAVTDAAIRARVESAVERTKGAATSRFLHR